MPEAPDKRILIVILLVILAIIFVVDSRRIEVDGVEELPPLPEPVTNNAAVAVTAAGRDFVISFAGLGPGKSHEDTHAKTFVFDSADNAWYEAASVPGAAGRLAASAVPVGDRALVFGGYTVAADGDEKSTPWVHSFDPVSGDFEELTEMPVPVDDAVAVNYANESIYLISGWHDFGNVNLVQRYDIDNDSWSQATPIPGKSVFGHAGGIVGNTIVYCDGVAIEPHADRRRDFVANAECFTGSIDKDNPRRIDWRIVEPHPGMPRYRMAAAGSSELNGVLFVGGSENPYNYDGIGYDGNPSSPAKGALLYRLDSASWQAIDIDAPATMDHRRLVAYKDGWLIVGGMLDDQRVTDSVNGFSLD